MLVYEIGGKFSNDSLFMKTRWKIASKDHCLRFYLGLPQLIVDKDTFNLEIEEVNSGGSIVKLYYRYFYNYKKRFVFYVNKYLKTYKQNLNIISW